MVSLQTISRGFATKRDRVYQAGSSREEGEEDFSLSAEVQSCKSRGVATRFG